MCNQRWHESTLPEDIKLSINSLPETTDFRQRIPLGLKTNRSGTIIIKLKDLDSYFSNYSISLLDSQEESLVDLRDNNEYHILLDPGEYHNRFFLDIVNLPTGIENFTELPGLFSAYASGEYLRVNIITPPMWNGMLTITNLTGQILKQEYISSEGYYEYLLPYKKHQL